MQEFWIGNEELVDLYDKRLGDAGYTNFKLARTNNRGDGKQHSPSIGKYIVELFWDLFA